MIEEVAQELYINAAQPTDNSHPTNNSNNEGQTNGAGGLSINAARKWLKVLFNLGVLSLIIVGVTYFALSLLPSRPAFLSNIVETFKIVLKI